MEDFINSIITNLENNGFPQKRVALPTEKMYEVADTKGVSFNLVLEALRDSHDIDSELGDEKIIFSKIDNAATSFDGMQDVEMMEKAKEMMANMDPAELKKMQDMFTNMSEEEKQSIMAKGRDMGFIK